MKFHQHPINWREVFKGLGVPMNMSKGLRDKMLKAHLYSLVDDDTIRNVGVQVESELLWEENGRPYYDVWPVVHVPFTKVDLSKVPCEAIRLPVPQLLLRFPVGRELGKCRTILVSEYKMPWDSRMFNRVHFMQQGDRTPVAGSRLLSVVINDGSYESACFDNKNIGCHAHTIVNTMLLPGKRISDILDLGKRNQFTDDELDENMILNAFKIVASISLLDKNTDLVEALCLPDDQANFDQCSNADVRARLLKRAATQGHKGFALGKHLRAAPGYRLPHFGIRWCGPGGADPRLRPIKGCVINGKLIVDVPSGNLDETEVV